MHIDFFNKFNLKTSEIYVYHILYNKKPEISIWNQNLFKEMIKIKDLDIKSKLVIGVIVALMILTVIMYVAKSNDNKMEEIEPQNEEIVEEAKEQNKIMVHVTGEVKNSGVVSLDEGSRVVDAIYSAGGETVDADLNKLNLAYVLNDGDKIYVPKKEDEQTEYITSGAGENVSSSTAQTSDSKIININTATVEELSTLPGIGNAIAERIVAYRMQNGKFENVEDIKNVTGIGDSKFNNIKDLITVK